jgi:hypothetical protein
MASEPRKNAGPFVKTLYAKCIDLKRDEADVTIPRSDSKSAITKLQWYSI